MPHGSRRSRAKRPGHWFLYPRDRRPQATAPWPEPLAQGSGKKRSRETAPSATSSGK